MKTTHFISVNGKKYIYTLISEKTEDGELIFFECPAARISQHFDKEDLVGVLENLPDWILECQKRMERQVDRIVFRISTLEKQNIEKKAQERGYKSTSAFLKELALRA